MMRYASSFVLLVVLPLPELYNVFEKEIVQEYEGGGEGRDGPLSEEEDDVLRDARGTLESADVHLDFFAFALAEERAAVPHLCRS